MPATDPLDSALSYLFSHELPQERVCQTLEDQRKILMAAGRVLLSTLFNMHRAAHKQNTLGPKTADSLDSMQYCAAGRFDITIPVVRQELEDTIMNVFIFAARSDDDEVSCFINDVAKNRFAEIDLFQAEARKRINTVAQTNL